MDRHIGDIRNKVWNLSGERQILCTGKVWAYYSASVVVRSDSQPYYATSLLPSFLMVPDKDVSYSGGNV